MFSQNEDQIEVAEGNFIENHWSNPKEEGQLDWSRGGALTGGGIGWTVEFLGASVSWIFHIFFT